MIRDCPIYQSPVNQSLIVRSYLSTNLANLANTANMYRDQNLFLHKIFQICPSLVKRIHLKFKKFEALETIKDVIITNGISRVIVESSHKNYKFEAISRKSKTMLFWFNETLIFSDFSFDLYLFLFIWNSWSL